jgi:hypothetical protein
MWMIIEFWQSPIYVKHQPQTKYVVDCFIYLLEHILTQFMCNIFKLQSL